MSAAFTPGPWQWVGDDEIEQAEHPFTSVAEVVRLAKNVDPDREQACANARLIAAAPDYDAFAERALPLLETLHSLTVVADARKIVWSCIKAGRAAQAKARGESL